MQGEAVLGLEAAAKGLVTAGTSVLNLVSGVYRKWFGYWLADLGADCTRSRSRGIRPSTRLRWRHIWMGIRRSGCAQWSIPRRPPEPSTPSIASGPSAANEAW